MGESITISVVATNTGDPTGIYKVTLKVNNVTVETKEITLAGGDSKQVSFSITKDTAGTYTANVDGLSGSFEVREAAVPAKPVNWPLLSGIIAGLIVAGLLTFFLVRKRTY